MIITYLSVRPPPERYHFRHNKPPDRSVSSSQEALATFLRSQFRMSLTTFESSLDLSANLADQYDGNHP